MKQVKGEGNEIDTRLCSCFITTFVDSSQSLILEATCELDVHPKDMLNAGKRAEGQYTVTDCKDI